jgi:hypothetical protein
MKKTTSTKSRQEAHKVEKEPSLRAQLNDTTLWLNQARLQLTVERQKFEADLAAAQQERMFWFWMCYNYKFHYNAHAVALDSGAITPAFRESLSTASMDLLMAPSEPDSRPTRSFHQDQGLHRVIFRPGSQQLPHDVAYATKKSHVAGA